MFFSPRLSYFALIPLLASGCSATMTQAERIANNRNLAVVAANSEASACNAAVNDFHSQEDALVYSKLLRGMSDPERLVKLSSKEVVGDDFVRSALTIWAAADKCIDSYLKNLSAVSAPAARVHRMFLESRDKARILLLEGKITVGEYNSKALELVGVRDQQLAEVGEREQQGLAQMHESEVRQRAAAWAAVSESMARSAERNTQALQQMQNSIQQNQPRFTNCYKVGNTINCTTR